MKYLGSLNEQQKIAVEATEGPVIILAGAGSGKTKTLITRIAHLIHKGVQPSQILAVTFTNKAAAEMKHRVGDVMRAHLTPEFGQRSWAQPWMGFSPSLPEVSTFHSFCVKLLRLEYREAGFTRPFVIYDDGDQLSLIKKVLEEFDISPKNSTPKRFKGAIDQFKCQAISPEEVDPADFFGPFGEQVKKVYARYQEVLRSCQAYDFGDLIVEAYKLLRDKPEILERYQKQFRYLMVDEYQDTNRAQYLLVTLLARKERNLCVVGDEDQSIYKWRGADIRNILDFQKDYPEAQLIKLEQNYRSTQNIIRAASAVIKNNNSRYEKTLWTANEVGEKVRWAQVSDERAEADYVGSQIQKWLRKHPEKTFQDIAVFYRSHAQSRSLEEIFRRLKVPYKIVGGVGFYERKEIKDLLAYLRLIVNPDDSVSFLRVINVPARGLGKSTLEKLERVAFELKTSTYVALKKVLEDAHGDFPPSVRKKLLDFSKLIESFRDLATRSTVAEVYHRILDGTGYVAELKAENSDESKGRIQNLEEFDTVIQFFEEDAQQRGINGGLELLQGFLNQVTLEASLLDKAEDFSSGSVSMMTLHSSKGLEYPLVFLVGCEEGIFPSRQSMGENDQDEEGIEEERRLCYVGITRAKKDLFMTSAQTRRIYGQMQVSSPSRFLSEIPTELLEAEILSQDVSSRFGVRAQWEGMRSERSYGGFSSSSAKKETRNEYDQTPSYEVKSIATEGGSSYRVGQKVKHESYGLGIVKQLEGSTSDRKITIEFSGRVTKKFSLNHVQLESV